MSSEEKELLLKDLCARLPYGVFMTNKKLRETFYPLTCEDLKDAMFDDDWDDIPYLRPMSSITEKEISDLQKINWQFNFNKFDNFAYVGAADDGFCSVPDMEKILSYLNEHYFDYRGLIEKNLALEAPEDMYEI